MTIASVETSYQQEIYVYIYKLRKQFIMDRIFLLAMGFICLYFSLRNNAAIIAPVLNPTIWIGPGHGTYFARTWRMTWMASWI